MTEISLKNKKIGILHSGGRVKPHDKYVISLMRQIWEEAGAQVVDIIGVDNHIPADLLILHVDLTQVPKSYIEFASLYPRTVNLGAVDIRKRTFCRHLLTASDSYKGPVLVKTNRNYAGIPELNDSHYFRSRLQQYRLGRLSIRKYRSLMRAILKNPPIMAKSDYRIFDHFSEIPKCYLDSRYVVQKFLPEISGDRYILREYYFFNDCEVINKETGHDPVFTHGDQIEYGRGVPASEVIELRSKLNLEYGKIDYAMNNGVPIIYDANKTIGLTSTTSDAAWSLARDLAPGITSCFRDSG